MYLVSDNCGDFAKIMSYKELVEMLIDEIIQNTKENWDDKDIVLANNKQLGKIAKDNLAVRLSENYLIDSLGAFCWYVINLKDLQKNIGDLRNIYAQKNKDISAFDKILELLDKGL